MSKFKHLNDEEIQQMLFDWRYRGWTTLDLLTEEEVDEINEELERIRLERVGTTSPEGKPWGDYDPFAYPHNFSNLSESLCGYANGS